jgi:hypothetical protein
LARLTMPTSLPPLATGDALDPLALEESRDIGERRLFGNRDHARRHDFADLFAVLCEFFSKRGRTGHRFQPPGPMFFGANLGAMDQVGLAKYAYQIAVLIENRKGTDIVLREKLGRLGHVRIGAHGHDIVHHHVDRPHIANLRIN